MTEGQGRMTEGQGRMTRTAERLRRHSMKKRRVNDKSGGAAPPVILSPFTGRRIPRGNYARSCRRYGLCRLRTGDSFAPLRMTEGQGRMTKERRSSAPVILSPFTGRKNPTGQLCSLMPPLWGVWTSYRGFFRSAQNDKRTAEQRPLSF